MGKDVEGRAEQLSFLPERDIFEIGRGYMNRMIAREGSETESQEQPANKGRRRVVNPRTYRDFYYEGLVLSANISEQTGQKLVLLTQYFPKQFGVNGIEPLKKKEAWYIGAKFNHVMDSAEKKAEQ